MSFYARQADYEGKFWVSVEKDGKVYAEASAVCRSVPKNVWRKWIRYELTLKAEETVEGGAFILSLEAAGTVEFDFISMMPSDAAAGIFRKDIFERLKENDIYVRWRDKERIDNHLRITIGTDEQMEALYRALEEICG